MLKCLVDVSDKYIYNALIAGREDDIDYKGAVLNMLRSVHDEGLHSHEQCKTYIGKMFRIKLYELDPETTDMQVCDYIIKYVAQKLSQ